MKTKQPLKSLGPNARILLIRLRSMGDCLLLTSPVRALKEEFPGFHVAVLVESRFADCFSLNPDFNEIIEVDGKLGVGARLLMRRFDAIVNLHGGPTSLIYAWMARGKRIGREHYKYRMLYDELAPRPDVSVHTVESTMVLFQWLGVSRDQAPPLRFELHEKEAALIRGQLQGGPYVVIHPASLMATKRWPAIRFAEVARDLAKRQLTVVVTAGPGEESFASQVAGGIDGAVVLLDLSIPELAELIRGARLYIGNDSGPMHLAAAVGTPTIAVWGSSASPRWRPWGVTHRLVQNPFECNPCPGYRCLVAESPLCIESITVDQVNAAVKELLSDHPVCAAKEREHFINGASTPPLEEGSGD